MDVMSLLAYILPLQPEQFTQTHASVDRKCYAVSMEFVGSAHRFLQRSLFLKGENTHFFGFDLWQLDA